MKTTVEAMLPARFLTALGVYMQTCAHIENVCWSIYVQNDPEAVIRDQKNPALLVKDSMSTQGLLKKLKGCARHCSAPIALRIHAVHNQLIDGLEARNTATHGAWFFDSSTETLRVEHKFVRRSDPSGVWRTYNEPLAQAVIDDAIENADLLLRELMSIRDHLQTERT